MCGIAGIWYNHKEKADTGIIKKMIDLIRHRGPDSEGIWISEDKSLYFGNRRLAIIDLSENGRQPFHYMGKYVITYNGEIYNYIEIRSFLLSKGYKFNSDTDTEVIVAAYDYWGKDCLLRFDGMFAFAIYDKEEEILFCARDRFGEKPFYYFQNDDVFMFASESKSLIAAGADKQIDDYSMYLFLNMGLHDDPADKSRTFYRNIKSLKPAHYIFYKKTQKLTQNKYWKIDSTIKSDLNFEQACSRFKELFIESVSKRLRSDVLVGTSLSGGIDSSTVTAVMNGILKNGSNHKGFSARFQDPSLDEGFFMKKIVEKTGIQHFEIFPNVNIMLEDLKKIVYFQEGPFSSASIYAQWEVYKLAHENNICVLLDGQGSDEYLAGYTHFFIPFFKEIYLKYGQTALEKTYNDYIANNEVQNPLTIDNKLLLQTKYYELHSFLRYFKFKLFGAAKMPEIHHNLYSSYKRNVSPFPVSNDLTGNLEFFTTVSGLDKLLRFADRNSMAHSCEVRLPFLSHELVEFVFSLPSDYKIREGWTKALLRYAFKDVLPNEIIWRKNKLGFRPPQENWEREKKYIDFATELQNIAIKEKYIANDAALSWNGMVTGLFIEMNKSL
ncbi:MAG TPA: asparagine synthase (glutamine-hydrolyzing) [Bacteroidales bacterium]|nr:asparagine synthase (glutamine-hydrolyzing) [Bacteroidales bacterium]